MSARSADAICLALIALGFALVALLYGELPDPMPVHWNPRGEADGFAPKPWGPFLLPLVTVATYVLMRALPAISPKGFRMESFIGVYRILVVTTVVFISGLNVLALLDATGSGVDLPRMVYLGLGLLFVILGNYMGKIRRNFFVGIRTPWTLADEEVWERTHRFGGKLFFAAGCLVIVAAVVGMGVGTVVAVTLAAALVSTVYSFIVYRRVAQ